jgi:aspartokinase
MINIEEHPVDSLSIDCESLMITMHNVPFGEYVMTRLLDDLAAASVNVNIISRTAPVGKTYDVSVIVPERDLAKVREIANNLGDDFPEVGITVNKDITRLNLHGIGMRTQSGVAAKYLRVFAENDIQILMITTSEIAMSCVVKNDDVKRAVTAIQAAFDLE